MKTTEKENPKEREKFERTMTKLFQVKKKERAEKIKKKSPKGKD